MLKAHSLVCYYSLFRTVKPFLTIKLIKYILLFRTPLFKYLVFVIILMFKVLQTGIKTAITNLQNISHLDTQNGYLSYKYIYLNNNVTVVTANMCGY